MHTQLRSNCFCELSRNFLTHTAFKCLPLWHTEDMKSGNVDEVGPKLRSNSFNTIVFLRGLHDFLVAKWNESWFMVWNLPLSDYIRYCRWCGCLRPISPLWGVAIATPGPCKGCSACFIGFYGVWGSPLKWLGDNIVEVKGKHSYEYERRLHFKTKVRRTFFCKIYLSNQRNLKSKSQMYLNI